MNKIKAWFQRFCLWAGAHPLLCALLFFVLSTAVRIAVNYRLGIITFNWRPDEYRFLHLAKSIAQRGELLIMGLPTNYQKLLYPLLISPAFALIKDPIGQLKLVGIINIVTMSSAVFPAALLAKRLTQKAEVLLLSLAAMVAMPEFLYTATLLSEALYLPLCLWAFYLFLRAMEEKDRLRRPLLFVLFGFVLYLLYFTKEVGLVFVLAAAGILLFEAIRDRRDKSKLKQNGLSLLAFALSFWALFFLMKLTLFRNQESIYTTESAFGMGDQLSLSALFSLKAILYLPYSAAVQLAAAILSFCVLPVLLPLFGFKSLSEQKKRLYLFSASSLVIMAATVAYTISIREDLWFLVPRLHMRYFFPLAVPFVILCFDFLLTEDRAKQARGKARRGKPAGKTEPLLSKKAIYIIAAAAWVLLMFLVPTYPGKDSPYDYFSMGATQLAEYMVGFGASAVSAALPWNLCKLFLLILLTVSLRWLLRGKKKTVLVALCCVMLTAFVWENFSGFQTIMVFKRPKGMNSDTAKPDVTFWAFEKDLVLNNELPQKYERLAKAAAGVSGYIESEDLDGVITCMDDKHWNILETFASQRRLWMPEYSLKEIQFYQDVQEDIIFEDGVANYIVVTDTYNPFTNVEVVYESGPYIVLRNLDPTKLLLAPN